MLGIGVFTVASLLVGLAQSPGWMIAARAVQGIGARDVGAVDAGAAVGELPRGHAADTGDGGLRRAGRRRHGVRPDRRRCADQRAVVALGLLSQRARRSGGDLGRPARAGRDRAQRRQARRGRRAVLHARGHCAGVRDRALRRRRVERRIDRRGAGGRRGAAGTLRRPSGARGAAADAPAAARRPRARRRLRRPFSVQRRAGQLLLLHDAVPPGRQRPHARCKLAWLSCPSPGPPSPPLPSPRARPHGSATTSWRSAAAPPCSPERRG